jgi:hypothetical protein
VEINAGTKVWAMDAVGERLSRIAASGVVPSHDFPVVWICAPEEWARARAEGREPDAVPWPAEAVDAERVG